MRGRPRKRRRVATLHTLLGVCQCSRRARAGIAAVLAAVLGSAWLLDAQAPPEPRVTFRLIVVSSAERAQQILEEVSAGGSFDAIARAQSTDPSAAQGGLIGPMALSDLRPELRDALRDLPIGGVQGVLRLPTGFGLVQRVEASFESVRGGEILAISAAGNVRATISVDGFSEANAALNTLEKPEDWNQSPRMICDLRVQAVTAVKSALTSRLGPRLAETRAAFPPEDVLEAHVALGQLHAYDGEMTETIAQFEAALRLAATVLPAAAPDILQSLGVAHLHKAEMDNGLYHAPGDRCLLSVQGGEALREPAHLTRAVDYFLQLLGARAEDIEAKWLLNVGYMATGGYPALVPPRYAIPTDAFASREQVGRFVDVAARAGVDSLSSAGGVIVEDLDGDGQLDILTSNFDSCGQIELFQRGPDGRFIDRAAGAGLSPQLGGLNLAQADYNNDGCMDFLVLRGGWELAQRKSLMRNNCDGTFTDVTDASGLARPATSTQTATWTDIDNDGWIDLFVGNEDTASQLFRNRGDGSFEDIAEAAGVARTAFTKAVHAGDYDNDGYPDLYVSNLRSANLLYRNNRNRTFTEVGAAAGVTGSDRGFPAWFFDYDNDGWDDLFVSSYFLSIEETARSYLRLPLNARTMRLYRNARDGTFTDVTGAAGLAQVHMPMGSNFGDIDNDGYLDVFLGTGSPSYAALTPSVLLKNKDGRTFVDVTASSGTGEMHKGHGVAFADLDHDGDLELVFKVGGATPGDAHAFRLFENPGHGNDWLGLKLVGVKTNRAALGARITVTVESASGDRRSIHRTVNSGGTFGASPLQQHVGLGRAPRRVEVDVFWPVSNTRQHFDNVARNQVIEIRELSDAYAPLQRKPSPLGDGNAR